MAEALCGLCSLSDKDLDRLVRRRLCERPASEEALAAVVEALRAMADELHRRTPGACPWPS